MTRSYCRAKLIFAGDLPLEWEAIKRGEWGEVPPYHGRAGRAVCCTAAMMSMLPLAHFFDPISVLFVVFGTLGGMMAIHGRGSLQLISAFTGWLFRPTTSTVLKNTFRLPPRPWTLASSRYRQAQWG